MSPLSWMTILLTCLSNAKQNIEPHIRCPHCNERIRIARHGCYWRFRFESDDKMAVARFRCRNPDCPRCTFSRLPHPYLPLIRIPVCVLMDLYQRHVVDGKSVSDCARYVGCRWNTARRALDLAKRLLVWIGQEVIAGTLSCQPCQPSEWPLLTRAYSYAFLPGRF